MDGTLTLAPKYSKDNTDVCGASAILTDLEGNTIILAADGVETMVEGYDRVRALYYGSGLYYTVTDADYNYGLIDWHGNVLLPCEYRDITMSGDGNYLLVEVDYDNSDLYEITFESDAAAPANTGDEGAAEDDGSADAADAEGGDNSSVIALLDSAATVLNTVSDGNYESVISLLENSKTLLGDGKADVTAIIDSVITLLGTDSVDVNSVNTLIQNAKNMLG